MTQTVELDVRSLLAAGQEPFAQIMDVVGHLLPEQSLTLRVPFKPVPLLNVMKRKGFKSSANLESDGSWQVLFTPVSKPFLTVSDNSQDVTGWAEPTQWVDLSGQDSAITRSTVLDVLNTLPKGEVIYALVAHAPGAWLDDLTKLGFQWAYSYDPVLEGFGLLVRKPAVVTD